MYWTLVVALLAGLAVVATVAWGLKIAATGKSRASEIAEQEADAVIGSERSAADVFIETVGSGKADPEEAAALLREQSCNLIPGSEGEMPTMERVREMSAEAYEAAVSESRRKAAGVILGGVISISAVALVVIAIIYQLNSSESSDPTSISPASSVTFTP